MPRETAAVERPEGLVYAPDFLSEHEEEAVLAVLESIELGEVRMRGQVARRRVRHFGYDYSYEAYDLEPADPLPEALVWLRERCGDLAAVPAGDFVQALVARYPPGASIGWHRDAPSFGPTVAGVSLGAGCRMRFQRRAAAARRTFTLELEPRSAYVLAGPSRSAWQHSIPAVRATRWSITFRTIRQPSRWAPPADAASGR